MLFLLNDNDPQVININKNETVPDWRYPGYWNMEVSNNIKIVTTKFNINNPGEHTLKIWRIDPGVVLQKIVIKTGEVAPGYLGPPESYNTVMMNN